MAKSFNKAVKTYVEKKEALNAINSWGWILLVLGVIYTIVSVISWENWYNLIFPIFCVWLGFSLILNVKTLRKYEKN